MAALRSVSAMMLGRRGCGATASSAAASLRSSGRGLENHQS
ncbi:hypothetical protein ACP4OV_031486 [Aristida adscensionis]